jgi:nucleoside-diphosphate-sugar epimerase
MSRYLITGATGFVGGAIALELIARTDADLVCLVRPGAHADAGARLEAAWRQAARVYNREHLLPQALERCQVLPGDVTLPRCGVADDAVPEVSEVWHAAASLAYKDESADEINRQNVAGTSEVLGLARAAGAETFNYISTAYVAGNRTGTVREELPAPGVECNNAYERSKIRAELLVAEAPFARVRIMRPSVVIGHSETYGATTFTGMYGFARGLRDLQREITKRLGGFLARRPLRLHADPSARINLIPIDVVARNAVSIATSATDASIFHLTNASPPTVGEAIRAIADAVGIRPPRYVDSSREFTSIDEEVDARLEFYNSYIRSDKQFERENTDAITGPDASDVPLTCERLRSFVDWYFTYLESWRAGASRAGAGGAR